MKSKKAGPRPVAKKRLDLDIKELELLVELQADQLQDAWVAYKRGDYATMVRLSRPLAELGDAKAQVMLGRSYAEGKGVPQDFKEGAKWIRRAAEQGFDLAQYELGLLYKEGQGVPQDYVEAYMWLNLAAAQGNEDARVQRDVVATYMTPAQLAEAQKRAREFRPVTEDASTRKQPEIPAQQIASTGTGFFVNDTGHILTNKHVVNECRAVQVRLPGGSAVGAEVLHTNTDVDLAVLKTEPSLAKKGMHWSGKAAEFRSEDTPRLGEGVVVYGFPLAGALSSEGNVTTGNITALAGPGDDDRLYQVSATVQPGNSGGPLFDESGRVVGIVVAKLDALKMAVATGDIPQNVNFAIKSGIATSSLGLYRIPYVASARPAQKYTVRVECLQ